MENKELSDINNEIINELFFLQNNLQNTHGSATKKAIKESLGKKIEMLKQKPEWTSLNLRQKIHLYSKFKELFDITKPNELLGHVQRIDMNNFEDSYIPQKIITIKKFDNQLEIEINNTIKKYSTICAALAIQPLPFADIFILTPTQILMGKKIADLRGYEIKENTIELILKEISGTIGMGIIAQQLVIGAYKTFLPFFGAVTTIPVVYGLTFGIGKTMDYYIKAKINGNQINKSEVEKIFKSSREIGEREGKLKEIHAKSKNNFK